MHPTTHVHRPRRGLFVATLVAVVALVAAGAGLAGSLSSAVLPERILSGPLDADDGYVATGASVSPWSRRPAIARLDGDLRTAVRRAARAARAEGLVLRVNGGWRSARYQRVLFRRAVKTYGSEAVARQYVLPPSRSSHVSGDAVDVGPVDAALWLEQRGGEWGLCRVYGNERWHFERAAEPGGTCPELRPDATAG